MGSNILPPIEPPEPGPEPRPEPTARRPIVCEFCQCRLAPSGDYLAMSERAKDFRAQGERIDRLTADVAAEREINDALRKQLDEANAALKALAAKDRKGLFA